MQGGFYFFNSPVSILRDNANDDKILFDEYEVVYEDLKEVINSFMRGYTRPEEYKSRYIFEGEEISIKRKASLTGLMSDICDRVYSKTPIINNEAINKNEITTVAQNSRNKIVAALLRNELETNLGFNGSGQEVSIMRSTLIRTGIWEENYGIPSINLKTKKVQFMDAMLSVIENFIIETKQIGKQSFANLYERLIAPEYHIGIRKGLIPIYLATVIHLYKREIIISDSYGQVPISVDLLTQINAKPDNFSISYLDWNPEREKYVHNLSVLFNEYVIETEKGSNSYDYVVSAMKRWYMALPKYAKESKFISEDIGIPKIYRRVLRLLKKNTNGNELLFEKLPAVFTPEITLDRLADEMSAMKQFYDNFVANVKKELVCFLKTSFVGASYADKVE